MSSSVKTYRVKLPVLSIRETIRMVKNIHHVLRVTENNLFCDCELCFKEIKDAPNAIGNET